MDAHTLENDLELKMCSPYYPLVSAYDISAYNTLNMSWNALNDANTSMNPNSTPQMEAYTLENDYENDHHPI